MKLKHEKECQWNQSQLFEKNNKIDYTKQAWQKQKERRYRVAQLGMRKWIAIHTSKTLKVEYGSTMNDPMSTN